MEAAQQNPQTPWMPATEHERALAQAQLALVLADHSFRNSQRYPALLRYVVEETLAGNADQLKERTIGVAVFHRPPDYDTNADPIVRVTAGEVRRRLAQYYQEHASELRIDLLTGSYVPHFHPPRLDEVTSAEATPQPDGTEAVPPFPSRDLPWKTYTFVLFLIAALLISATAALVIEHSHRRDALAQFWAPIMQTHQPVAFIVGGRKSVYLAEDGTPLPLLRSVTPSSQAGPEEPPEHVVTISVGDAFAFARVASLVTREGLRYTAASSAQTSLEDLRANPSVLFGAFNNNWTLHAVSQLRYRLAYDKPPGYSGIVWVADAKDPGNRKWSFNCQQSADAASRDYAVVARYFDPQTEQQTVIAAGLQQNGTTAASEFLTSSRYLAQLDAFAPKGGWAKRNLEAVIETDVVGGRSGPPRVVAVTFW